MVNKKKSTNALLFDGLEDSDCEERNDESSTQAVVVKEERKTPPLPLSTMKKDNNVEFSPPIKYSNTEVA